MASKPLYDVRPLLPWLERGDTVLTANHRLTRYIQRARDEQLREAGHRAWATAPVAAVESWLLARWEDAVDEGRAPPRTCLDPPAIHYLWRRVIASDRDATTGFTLLQPGEAARLAQRARDALLRWRIDTADEATRQAFRLGGDSAHFLRWLARFDEELQRLGAATPADCLRDLLAASARPAQPLLLVACDDLSPLVHGCLEALGDPLERASEPGATAQRDVRCYAGTGDELRAIAEWCAERSRAAPGARIGVVLGADPEHRAALDYQLRRAFGCVDANYHRLPVNYSAGLALDRTPLVRDGLNLLELLRGSIDLPVLLALLRSRFIDLPDRDSPATVVLVDELRELGARRLDLGLLRYLAGRRETVLGERLLALRDRRDRSGMQGGGDWVELFRWLLDSFGWPGARLDSLEYQQHGLWEETLESFARCAALGPSLGAEDALQLLRDCCSQRIFQPKTADSDVQVLGALEASGLAFDALWVAGMHAGAWPAPARPNPLLPLALQRQQHMPQATPEGERAFAARLLSRYETAVETLVLSTALAADGAPQLPSPFLGEVPEAAAPAPAGEAAWRERRASCALAVVEDPRGPPVGEEGVRGGAGLLEAQAACPFQAFARFRLELAGPAEPWAGLTPLERGVLLHRALDALWGGLGDSDALAGLSIHDRRRRCEAAAGDAVLSLRRDRRQVVGEACVALEQERLVDTLHAWLAVEAERPEPFCVAAREESAELSLGGLALTVKLDRVDRLSDGREVVIDYKSGRTSLAGLFRERLASPQLPLYSLARGPALAGVAFAQLRPRDQRFLGLGERDALPGMAKALTKALAKAAGDEPAPGGWQALRDAWRDRLEALADEVGAGAAGVEPAPGACRYCDLGSLCRVGSVGEDGP